jgi:hypothetical protein
MIMKTVTSDKCHVTSKSDFGLSLITRNSSLFNLAFVLVCLACVPLTGCEMVHLAALPQQSRHQVASANVPLPAVAVSPAHEAARSVSRWLYAAAGFCLLACGALAYFGQVWPAVKCGLAGITLPIFAAWYSEHFAWVIAALLVALAIYFAIYQHRFITPLVKRIEELEAMQMTKP